MIAILITWLVLAIIGAGCFRFAAVFDRYDDSAKDIAEYSPEVEG